MKSVWIDDWLTPRSFRSSADRSVAQSAAGGAAGAAARAVWVREAARSPGAGPAWAGGADRLGFHVWRAPRGRFGCPAPPAAGAGLAGATRLRNRPPESLDIRLAEDGL